jgi:FAD/FMN-containing dehydrogenase
MNNFFLGVFNKFYFYKNRTKSGINNIEKFFFPLDKIANWNSFYGKKGFLQYQFVVPRKNIYKVFDKILTLKIKPFLCVIKIFEKSNKNYLSFPSNGISLAMDLHNNDINIKKLNLLNELITKLGGKIYLTKDSILKENEFRKMYPNWKKILKINSGLFLSIQTQRLGYK